MRPIIQDLQLSAEDRQLIYKGSLNRRGGAGDKEELQVFLFDHAVLMVKQKTKADQHKVYRRVSKGASHWRMRA
jgi:RHO1 GDP-GTP exchange protein 1/2